MGELSSDDDAYGHAHQSGAPGGRVGNTLFQQHFPKMSFPRFNVENPRIWKDKCLNYLQFINLPEALWLPTATMCMDDNGSRWLQVYKLKQGLADWNSFITVMEEQFGSYDYSDAIGDLVALTQDGNLDEYMTTFYGLQYQVQMHNSGLDETSFVTQFVRGLKPKLDAAVQSQVPKNMKKAVMLAKVQQQLMDSKQMKFSKYNGRNYVPRFDSKPTANTGGLWKERPLYLLWG
jgi:hypothetical protein